MILTLSPKIVKTEDVLDTDYEDAGTSYLGGCAQRASKRQAGKRAFQGLAWSVSGGLMLGLYTHTIPGHQTLKQKPNHSVFVVKPKRCWCFLARHAATTRHHDSSDWRCV